MSSITLTMLFLRIFSNRLHSLNAFTYEFCISYTASIQYYIVFTDIVGVIIGFEGYKKL